MSDPNPPRRVPGRTPGAARSGAGAHVQTEKRKTPFAIIGVVVVVLAVGGYFLLNDPAKAERDLGQQLGNPEAHSIPAAKGQVGSVTLVDETIVKLGSESSVKVPASMDVKVRGVSLIGTAMFTVKPVTSDTAKPFRVRVRNVDVISKGGSFAIRAYDNEEKDVEVIAREGNLQINPNNKKAELQTLAVGPTGIAIDADGKVTPMTKEATDQAFSWVDGNVTVANVPLIGMKKIMDRWYNTNFFIVDKSLETRPVTATLPLESSKMALDAIGNAAKVHIAFRGDTMTLADGAPPAEKPAAAAKGGKKGK
jgi:ferric-dicitrate binding protein FerR (iron transport regulator)